MGISPHVFLPFRSLGATLRGLLGKLMASAHRTPRSHGRLLPQASGKGKVHTHQEPTPRKECTTWGHAGSSECDVGVIYRHAGVHVGWRPAAQRSAVQCRAGPGRARPGRARPGVRVCTDWPITPGPTPWLLPAGWVLSLCPQALALSPAPSQTSVLSGRV